MKILIGGSPCTHWSIAQTKNRETQPNSGIGWELFKNYLIAKEKFKPDYFLYENNKSAAQPIKDQISKELGVDLMHINSALVSAQNRQRFYAFNWTVDQPEDRGILLKDILETGVDLTSNEKSYALTTRCSGAIPEDTISRRRHSMVAEPYEFIDYELRKNSEIVTNDNSIRCARNDAKKSSAQETVVKFPESKSNAFVAAHTPKVIDRAEYYDVDRKRVYKVENGFITIKDKQYPIKLADGFYIIRKLTPVECERLQTMPDGYTSAVSNAQRYKGLGNGWTAEVIIHILNGILKDVPRDEEIVVLSMYDGIGTGRYCLDKMGFTNVKYYAYEIDKFAKQIAMSNYPDIIQCGDAFQVRDSEWHL